jgi:lipoprotein-releasing system ATP-binding protein
MDSHTVNGDLDETGAALVSARGIAKSFRNNGASIKVLEDLDFDFMVGETIAVVGASGIGKSTLLHIMGSLDRPDNGVLYFKGRDIFLLDETALASHRNRSIGFVFQFHHLLSEFSALENAMMPALIAGLEKPGAMTAAEAILVRVGLQDRLHHRVNKLSGGEQQRVALARALVLNPALLLADEPTGNLDNKNSGQIHELLLQLNEELSMTMVVVTHNPELASIMSRKVTIENRRLIDTCE